MNLTSKIIKHEQFKDVAFLVAEQEIFPHSVNLHGVWINQGFVQSWIICSDELNILDNKISEWYYLNDDHLKFIYQGECLRYSDKWVRINE